MTVRALEIAADRYAPVRRAALVAAGLGGLGCAVGLVVDPPQLLRSWLLAFVFWLSLPLGALGILMIHGLTGGRWGLAIHELLAAGARTLPLLAIAFVPFWFGLSHLYPWAMPSRESEHLRHLEPYLNVPFWSLRSVLALGMWCVLALLLGRSRPRAATGVAAVGLILHVLAVTVTSVDWVMALDEHWTSMAFGVKTLAGQMIAALSAALVALGLASLRPELRERLPAERFHELGNLLLTLVMLWSYVAFSEWMIVWSGNLPPEIRWYEHRASQGWAAVAFALIVLHFFVPFALLLFRRVKRSVRAITALAAWLLVMRLVDHFWLIVPSAQHSGSAPHWLDFAAPCALGGAWVLVAVHLLGKRPFAFVETQEEETG